MEELTQALGRIATALEGVDKKLSDIEETIEGLGAGVVESLTEDVCGKLSEIEKDVDRLDG